MHEERWWGDWQNANIRGCLKSQVLKGTVSLRCWFRTAWHTNQKTDPGCGQQGGGGTRVSLGKESQASVFLSKHGQRRCPRSRAGRIKPREFAIPSGLFCSPGPTRKYKGHGVPLCAVIWCDHRRAVNPLRVSVYSTEPRLQVRNSTLNVVNTT